MNAYERSTIGNIAIIKNIIFGNNEKKELDHSWENGRPCLILFDDDEFIYFLPLTSTERQGIYEKQYYKLSEEDYSYRNKSRYTNYKKVPRKNNDLKGYVNLEQVYKMPIYGMDETGKLKYYTYKSIVEKFKEYHKNDNMEELISQAKDISIKR